MWRAFVHGENEGEVPLEAAEANSLVVSTCGFDL